MEAQARRALSLSILLLTAACAGSPAAPSYQDQEAKQFAPPPPGQGALYIYRKELWNVARPIDVGVVGGATARIGVNDYLYIQGPPGPLDVQCKLGDKTGGLQVNVDPGRTTYVEVSTKVGMWTPGCEVAEVPPPQGQAAVRASRRIEFQ